MRRKNLTKMARTINKMANMATYKSAILGGLPAPSLTLIEETGSTEARGVFIPKKNAMPGDMVCFNGDGEMRVISGPSYNGAIKNEWTAEAMVVIPFSHTENFDGKLHCCALKPLDNRNDNGTHGVSAQFAGYSVNKTTQTIPVGVPTRQPEESSVLLSEYGFVPTNIWEASENLSEDGYTTYAEGADEEHLIPSVYTNAFAFNNDLFGFDNGSISNVFDNGRTWTDVNPQIEILTGGLDDETIESLPSNTLDAYSQMYANDGAFYKTENIGDDSNHNMWHIPYGWELAYFLSTFGTTRNYLSGYSDDEEFPTDKKLLSYCGGRPNQAQASVPQIWTANLQNGKLEKEPIKETSSVEPDFYLFTLIPFVSL